MNSELFFAQGSTLGGEGELHCWKNLSIVNGYQGT